MNRSHWLLSALCVVLLATASPGYAARQVCGIDLSTIDGYDWDTFSSTDGVEQAEKSLPPSQMSRAIHAKAIRLSAQWPFEMAQKVIAVTEGVEVGTFNPSDFKLGDQLGSDGLRKQQFAFVATSSAFELPPSNQAEICSPDPVAVAKVGRFIQLGYQAYATVLEGPMGDTAEKFALLEKQYDMYLFEGFPMWPWEAWANGELLTDDSIANGPPRNQLALFHPSAGILASVESDADNDLGANLMVEALGWIHYSEDYKTWWGVSAAAVLPFDRDPGYGMAFTYKQFKLGVTWHDDDDYDGVAVVLNIDLYQFISEKYRDYSGYLNKVHSHKQ